MQQVRFNTQKALADGFTQDQINQHLAMRQKQGISFVQDQQPQQQDQSQQQKGNGFLDLLPLLGSVAGSFTPLGPIFGGAAGGAVGQGAKELFGGGGNVGDIAKEGLLGGVGGVIGKGLGFLGGKAAGVVGSKLTKLGEDTAIKGLRLNPSQITKFKTRHGEDLGRFLASEGMIGKDVSQIAAERINPLQENFNQIAKQSGLKVNPDVFLKNIDAQADELIKAGGSENRALAKKIQNEGLLLWQNDLAPANFDISKVDKLRSTFAKKVNWNDPAKATMDHALADALRKTAIDTADEAGATMGELGLKDIGIKLSKYRDLEKAAVAQEALGRGKMPMGITNWLSLGAGLAGGDAMGGAVGLASNMIVNNPSVIRAGAKGMMNTGDALLNAGKSDLGGTIAGRTTVQSGVRAPFAEMQGDQTSLPMERQVDQSTLGMDNQSGQDSQQENIRKVIGTIMLQNAKSGTEAAAAYNFLFPESKQKPLSGEQQKTKTNAESGLRALDIVQRSIQQDPFATTKAKIPVVNQRSPYASASREISDVLARLRTGAALTENEEKFYGSQLPQPLDSPETINYKLNLFRSLFSSFANGQQPTGESQMITQ